MYNNNGKEYFEVNHSVKYVKYYGTQSRNFEGIFDKFQAIDTVMPDVLKIKLNNLNEELFYRKISEIDSVFITNELIYKRDGTKQCCFNHVLLQTKGSVNLKEFLEKYDIPYLSFEKFGVYENEYLLKLSVPEALYYSNKLFETGLFVYAQPSFYRFDVFNNPMYQEQWGLKNTGQHGGTVGIDINVEPAWNLSSGKDIKIAVIDCGVQLDHPDLQDNLLYGYDAIDNNNNGSHTGNNNHGTCCAGIIAACDNSIGIKGVAYKSKIIPIRIAFGYNLNDEYIIRAFRHASERGVDVISCSWSGGSENQTITNIINHIVENGRDGLGTPVLFSSGNHYYQHPETSVKYPAYLPSTIAVGAINYCGERIILGGTLNYHNCDGKNSWGSCFGIGLDVVAPGINIPTTNIGSEYEHYFVGTSAACPHAAGVMALMLSANPCLTQEEAKRILFLSCDKLDQYSFCDINENLSWNNEVGYGKINAYKAVLYSLSANKYNIQINGNLVSTEDDVILFIEDGMCSVLSAGLYFCKKYEYSASISFPNMNDPHITVMANGLSAATYNNGTYYASASTITDTSAVLKTWRYYITSNTAGQANNIYIPSNDNVVFYATVFDIPKNNLNLTNQNILSGTLNRNALKNLHTNNVHISGSAEVYLFAGDSVVLNAGTRISPSSGYFCAQSGVYNTCKPNVSQRSIIYNQYNNYEDKIINDDIKIVSIYPNPNNGSFHIMFSDNENEIINVRVTDVMGKIVYSNNSFKGGEIYLPNANRGLYYVTVTLKDKIITEKIVIQ